MAVTSRSDVRRNPARFNLHPRFKHASALQGLEKRGILTPIKYGASKKSPTFYSDDELLSVSERCRIVKA
jgi:hypothetical protein